METLRTKVHVTPRARNELFTRRWPLRYLRISLSLITMIERNNNSVTIIGQSSWKYSGGATKRNRNIKSVKLFFQVKRHISQCMYVIYVYQ